jgi:hypothetical protein
VSTRIEVHRHQCSPAVPAYGDGAGREAPASHAAFTAFAERVKKSHHDILLSPASPTPPSPAKSMPLRSVKGNCFRCLTPLKNHSVADCRDSLCCRGCRRSGHRLHECTIPRPSPTTSPTARRTPPPSPPAPPSPRPTIPYPSAIGSPCLSPRSTLTPLCMQSFSPTAARCGSGSFSGPATVDEDLPTAAAAAADPGSP